MGENTKIEWADHTFNTWEGCMKVSPACKNCYAASRDGIWHGGKHWGPGSTRKPMATSYWNKPLRWNAEAAAAGKRARVFCSSLADIFEGPDTCTDLDSLGMMRAARIKLFRMIIDTPHLDWLLLTKRPFNIQGIILDVGDNTQDHDVRDMCYNWIEGRPPHNVWLGTSVENNAVKKTRLQALLSMAAVVHFISAEPLLEDLDLESVLVQVQHPDNEGKGVAALQLLDWVICGGESGHGARPMHPAWVRSLQRQCQESGVAFLFKQWGEYQFHVEAYKVDFNLAKRPIHKSPDVYLHEDGRTATIDEAVGQGGEWTGMWKLGKKHTGRILDGKEYNEFPTPRDYGK